jgi:hypothetical protein
MKNPSEYLLSPIKLRIYQDWQPAIDQAEILVRQSKIRHSDIRRVGNVDFHDIGALGSVGHHYISRHWYILSGGWMRKHFKWLNKMCEDMAEIEPDPTLTIARSDVAEHVDLGAGPTAMNYPVFTADAETWVRDDDGTEYSYPSIANEPWMLHTHVPHGVRLRSPFRVCLGVHFAKDYRTVRAWFDKHPDLVYGE